MNLEAFGRAPTERLPVEKGGGRMAMDGEKVVWRWMIVGALVSVFLVGLLVLSGRGCACAEWSQPNQVIANKCHCEGDTETGQGTTEVDLDFTKKLKAPTTEPVCTVWVLMENLSKTRVWIDTRVRCQR
jgi:hypothetical protein